MTKFSETSAATVDTSNAYDTVLVNPTLLVGKLFTVWDTKEGMTRDKRDEDPPGPAPRPYCLITLMCTQLEQSLDYYKKDGTPVFKNVTCFCSPAMMLQARQWTSKIYPIEDVTLIRNVNGAFEFAPYSDMDGSDSPF